jgi:hypothetical protein
MPKSISCHTFGTSKHGNVRELTVWRSCQYVGMKEALSMEARPSFALQDAGQKAQLLLHKKCARALVGMDKDKDVLKHALHVPGRPAVSALSQVA